MPECVFTVSSIEMDIDVEYLYLNSAYPLIRHISWFWCKMRCNDQRMRTDNYESMCIEQIFCLESFHELNLFENTTLLHTCESASQIYRILFSWINEFSPPFTEIYDAIYDRFVTAWRQWSLLLGSVIKWSTFSKMLRHQLIFEISRIKEQ